MLKGKYGYSSLGLPEVKGVAGCSEGWRSMVQTWNHILQGGRWILNNGESTMFWEDT